MIGPTDKCAFSAISESVKPQARSVFIRFGNVAMFNKWLLFGCPGDREAFGQISICRIWQRCHFRQMGQIVMERCPNQPQSLRDSALINRMMISSLCSEEPIPPVWEIMG